MARPTQVMPLPLVCAVMTHLPDPPPAKRWGGSICNRLRLQIGVGGILCSAVCPPPLTPPHPTQERVGGGERIRLAYARSCVRLLQRAAHDGAHEIAAILGRGLVILHRLDRVRGRFGGG